jgi:hypothetical protein
MSGDRRFAPDWLALREPADRAARSRSLANTTIDALRSDGLVRVLDLGAGTGANVRYLTELLPADQDWLLVDYDASLLQEAPMRMTSWGRERNHRVSREPDAIRLHGSERTTRLRTRCVDLRTFEEAPFEPEGVFREHESLFDGRALVTAAALLDLVSAPWLDRLTDECRRCGAAILFALTYDGRITCVPEEPEDEWIRQLVNRHQRTDKGFGDALGPAAADRARRCFEASGYRIVSERSDWVLSPENDMLQQQLIEGWAQAASVMAPEALRTIHDWRGRRLAHVTRRCSSLIVGHQDLGGWLASKFP